MNIGRQVRRHMVADAPQADVVVEITIGKGHIMETAKANDLCDQIASEFMKVLASTPGLSCPLSKIKLRGR